MEIDERFSKVGNDPRYKKIAKKERKVKIDSRFEKMFTDKNFHTKFSTDKRGKVINETEQEDLHKFYEIDENDDGEEDEASSGVVEVNEESCDSVEEKKKLKRKGKLESAKDVRLSKKAKLSGKKNVESEESDKKSGKKIVKKSSNKINFDDIRGETLPVGYDSDDSDDSDVESTNSNKPYESGEDNNAEEEITHGWGEVDENIKCIENAETYRLAICNCDWDKVGANDLLILLDSFKPLNGTVKSLKIYPSEFGMERMKEEKVLGPKELREVDDVNGEDNEQGSSFHMEKLREYQINRLKYYYAVAVCDSVATASKLYEELDGQEYEMSATRMDMRFIPNDTTFDQEPKSVASGIAQLKDYEPVSFHNTALQQTTVRLTWDETDTKRVQTTMKQFTQEDIENMDFKDYLGSSGDESEGDEIIENIGSKIDTTKVTQDQRIQIYQELMQEIEAKEEKINEKADMEVSFKTTTDVDAAAKDEDKSGDDTEGSDEESEGDDGDIDDDIDDGGDNGVSEDDSNDTFFDSVSVPDKTNKENSEEGFNDPFFGNASVPDKSEKSKSKKKRKKSLKEGEEKLSESELKQKSELELLMLDESDDKKHFNLKNILEQEKSKKSKKNKKKKKVTEEDTFNIDVEDPRFGALYSSHHYALDPSEPNFKKTKATEAIIKETQKRRNENELGNKKDDSKLANKLDTKIDTKLSGLINSVKSKTMLHNKKKEKKEKKSK